MNQKSLVALPLQVLVAASGSVTTGSAVDTAGYANTGRREMRVRLTGFIGTNTTGLSAKVQECATTNGTYTDCPGTTASITTSGGGDGFVSNSKRYLRSVLTPAGTTASAQGHVEVFVENRVS